MRIYTFTKPGFKARQSAKLKNNNQRGAILVSCDLNDDPKIGLLHSQKDYTLLPTYLEILFHLDLEAEKWEISEQAFKDWFRKRFNVGNKFDIEKRLNWLSISGLLGFYCDPIEVLLSEKAPIEQAETRVALRATITNQPTKIPLTPKGGMRRFEEFWLVWPKKVDKARAEKVWLRKKLDPYADKIILSVRAHIATEEWRKAYGQYIPYPSTFLNGERWQDEISSASGAPAWEETLTKPQKALLERKRWLLSHSSFTLYGSHLPRDRIQDMPSSINYVLVDGKETLVKELIPIEQEALDGRLL